MLTPASAYDRCSRCHVHSGTGPAAYRGACVYCFAKKVLLYVEILVNNGIINRDYQEVEGCQSIF